VWDDYERRIVVDQTVFTTVLWIAAAGVLSLWMARRRKRKLLDK